jgi:hypothetical protein
MSGGIPVTQSGMTILFLLGIYFVTMLILWYYTWTYRKPPTPKTEVPFALFEGQTILGVMDTQKSIRFCVGNDAMDEKSYE